MMVNKDGEKKMDEKHRTVIAETSAGQIEYLERNAAVDNPKGVIVTIRGAWRAHCDFYASHGDQKPGCGIPEGNTGINCLTR